VDALRAGFQPIVVEDPRPAKDCEDGFAHAEAGNAEELMQWLIAPYSLDDFMRLTWERRPLYVSRNANKKYLDGWLSKEDVDGWLRAGKMRYGVNVDVTSYVNGVRETHNINDDSDDDEEPRFADAASVWKKFDEKGCSLRILHPQRWKDALWKMLSTMERYWNCSTGCNVYLTPPNSQGFSPHFDDIDAFVLQLEGKKTWRVYPPRSEEEMLPRYSSPNFAQDEIGEPVLEVILEPGDVLYMPRGTVHQASCVDGEHSLHVTLSTNQFNTWADVLELALPAAIRDAGAFYTLVPIRPRRRGERRSLRTFPGASLRPHLAFNTRPRRLSTPPTDAFQLHPDMRSYGTTLSRGAPRAAAVPATGHASAARDRRERRRRRW
jgi:lysine-specific demethylase/histidyl-hydroxylase NO66